jgi:hypothetical protein
VIVIRLRFNSRGNGLGPGFSPLRSRVSAIMAQVWVASVTARLLHHKEWTVTDMPNQTNQQRYLACPVSSQEEAHHLAANII